MVTNLRNIIWTKPDLTTAVTYLLDDCTQTPQQHAKILMMRGDVPSDWVAVAFDQEVSE
jgi:hypothetical protein